MTFLRRNDASANSELILSSITVPDGFELTLRHALAEAIPINGTSIQVATVRLLPPGADLNSGPQTGSIQLARIGTPGTNMQDGLRQYANWQGEVIVPGGWTVQGYSVFSSNLQLNTVVLNVAGVIRAV